MLTTFEMDKRNRRERKLLKKLTDLTLNQKLVWREAGLGFMTVLKLKGKMLRVEIQRIEGSDSEMPFGHNTPSQTCMYIRDHRYGDLLCWCCCSDEMSVLRGAVRKMNRASQERRGVKKLDYVQNHHWFNGSEFQDLLKNLNKM